MTTRRASAIFVGALLAQLAAHSAAFADEVTLPPSRDNTLFGEDGALGNGAGEHFFCGQTNDGFARRALVAFDIAGALPAGSTIVSATLTMNMSKTKAFDLDVSLYPVLSDWGEGVSDAPAEEGAGAPAEPGDATWTHAFYDTVPWSTAGGDFDPTASATTAVGRTIGPYVWSSAQMAVDVQGWLDDPSSNFGWLIDAAVAGDRDAKRFDSREHGTASLRPRLVVSFTPPPGSGACCAADGACTVTSGAGACGGDFQGGGSACTPNPCPEPVGACCLPNAAATCVEQTATLCTGDSGTYQGALSSCSVVDCPVVLTPYLDALPLPAVAQPTTGAPGGIASYRLTMVERQQQLHAELPPSTVWGFDDGVTGGTFPGPTIEATTDLPVTVTWANDLRDGSDALRTDHYLEVDTCPHGADDASPRTVVHLHGGHVQAQYDGYPESWFLPGNEVVYEYPNWQPAATLWYHDHALGITRLNVYMGMAGFYIVRDASEAALDLPAGEFEVPVVIQDRTFLPDGSLYYPAMWQDHFFGETIVVNGKAWPYLDVKQGKYRLRLLNGCTSRMLELYLSDGGSFEVIGTDGGLLEAPVTTSLLRLASGERLDVVVDFEGYSAGTELLLLNQAPAPYPGTVGVGVVPEVMKFRVVGVPGHVDPVPSSLVTVEPLPEGDAVASRDFLLEKGTDACSGSAWFINGLRWDDITETPQLGTSEVWRFINNSGVVHPMHMHLVFFQVLDRQPFEMVGGVPTPIGPAVAPAAVEQGWKDTVQVAPGEMVRVVAKFEDFVGKFPYHCHILEHEDHEMMRQFETFTVCGDGARGIPGEECDDGNTDPGDGCSPTCAVETVPDAGPPDAMLPDASVPDAAPPDAVVMVPDATVPDATVPDATVPDATVPDAAPNAVDAAPGDAATADAAPPAIDASSSTPDAGAPLPADASPPSPDAATNGGSDGGCGCSAGDNGATPPLLAVVVLLWLLRRRRTAPDVE